MVPLKLKKGDKFTILDNSTELFFAKTALDATPPFVRNPPGTPITPTVEYWEQLEEETITIDRMTTVAENGPVIYSLLVGSRPKKSRRSR